MSEISGKIMLHPDRAINTSANTSEQDERAVSGRNLHCSEREAIDRFVQDARQFDDSIMLCIRCHGK
ncbi:MAG: hypothetical protein K6C12_02920 [Oscillospiraceae bacterium]|nr:hypothetical protein [Oscillospiraceae bacterium]